MRQKKEENLLKIFLIAILIVQVILIGISNLTLIDNNIDCDNAKMFVHIMEMWKQRTIAIPGWSYMTTLELDCSSVLALPIYALTGNIYLAFGIANIMFLIAFIAVLWYLFSDKNVLYPVLSANLLCIPYATGMLDYYNMMFFAGAQYILKVLLPILLIAVLVRTSMEKTWRKRDWIASGAFLVLFFITSMSSGVYVLFIGIVPIAAVYVLYKILNSEKFYAKQIVLLGVTIVLGIVGIYFNKYIMGGARGTNEMFIVWVHQVLANVSTCLTGIFELFGAASYVSDLPVLSYQGISIVAKACMVILFFVCGAVALCKIIKKKADLRLTLLLSVFLWNLFVLLITNTRAGSATYEYRYHLIGMVPLMIITSSVLLDAFGQLDAVQKKFLGLTGVGVIVIMSALSFPAIFDGEDTCSDLKELCEYCDDYELDYVYLYDGSNDADMCRLIQQDGDPLYLCITPGGTTWAYDYYEEYTNAEINAQKAIVVIKSEGEVMPDTLDMYGFQIKKFATVAERDLYYFEAEGMPVEIK